MRIIECSQGSPEWLAARIGIVTASNMDKILTPQTMKPSGSQGAYLAHLVAEWFLGVSLDEYKSPYVERGNELEKCALAHYEFTHDVATTPAGFCIRDDGKVGASPDALVGDLGGTELKCPSPATHMNYLLNGPPKEYRCQVQGSLWITGRKWWDLLCWHPVFEAVEVHNERDEEFIGILAPTVEAFVLRLDEAKAKLAKAKSEYDERKAMLRARMEPGTVDVPHDAPGELQEALNGFR